MLFFGWIFQKKKLWNSIYFYAYMWNLREASEFNRFALVQPALMHKAWTGSNLISPEQDQTWFLKNATQDSHTQIELYINRYLQMPLIPAF